MATLTRSLGHEVFERDLSKAPWLESCLLMPLRVAGLAAGNMGRHQLPIRAAALTYVTLFSLVPTLAVAFAVFRALSGLEWARQEIMPRLMAYVAAGSQAVVEAQIDAVIDNIHGGAIGGVGIVFLLGSAIFLVAGVEDAFNQIWESAKPRSLIRRITVYWTILTVPPLLLMGGLRIPTLLQRFGANPLAIEATPAVSVLLALIVPLLLICMGFTLLYLFIPNAPVKIGPAVVGAVAGGTLWWVALRYAYAGVEAMSVTYSKIYGSLSALPIFLFWVFLTWLIVLFGAEIAAAVQHAPWTPVRRSRRPVSQSARELLALRVMMEVVRRFRDGAPPASVEDLYDEIQAPMGLTNDAVQQLCAAGMLAQAGDQQRLLLQRDPAAVSPTELLQALRHAGDDAIWDGEDPTTVALGAWQTDADRAATEAGASTSVLDLTLMRPASS